MRSDEVLGDLVGDGRAETGVEGCVKELGKRAVGTALTPTICGRKDLAGMLA
jgi:hypothetical protein